MTQIQNLNELAQGNMTAFLNVKRGKGLKKATLRSFENKVRQFEEWRAELGKEYSDLDQSDISAYLIHLEEVVGQVSSTRTCSLTVCKQYMRWVLTGGKKNGQLKGQVPECMAGLEVKDDKSQKPDVHVTPELLDQILADQPTLPRKVLFAMLYDTGARQGEMRKVQVKHVDRDEYAQYVDVNGKTGYRRIYLHESLPLLLPYLNSLPADPETYLFPRATDPSQPVNGKTISRYMLVTAKHLKARGILKADDRLRPHSLRHTKARNLKNEGWPHDRICKWMGWSIKSNMIARYGEARLEDVASAFLQSTGQASKDELVQHLECPVCTTKSGVTCKFCPACGHSLRPEFAADRKNEENTLERQAEMQQMRQLFQKMRELPNLAEELGL